VTAGPTATLGVLGGGQLGRMFVHAAQTLGFRTAVLDPDPDSPAGRVSHLHLQAAYTDEAALAEMARVTRPGGRMVVSTWGHVDDCPGFAGVIAAIESLKGGRATELLRTAFSMGDPDELAEIADDAGLDAVRVTSHTIDAEFDSLADIAQAYCTSLAIGDPSEAGALEGELARTMGPWMRGESVAFPVSGLILQARA
jgi:SAM-dependent methyltransferase